MFCITASTHEDRLAGVSNRGASVDLTASGWGIYTTVVQSQNGTGYGYFSGTSESTPLAAAAAALVWSMFPHFSAGDVELILQKSSAQIAAIRAEIVGGSGRLDLYAALQYARELTDAGVSPADQDPVAISTEEIVPQKAPQP